MTIDINSIPETEYPDFKGGEKSLFARMYFDGTLRLMKATLPPGASIGEHTHTDNAEVIIIDSGHALAITDGEPEHLSAGQVHYCPQGHTHTLINDSDEPLHFTAMIK